MYEKKIQISMGRWFDNEIINFWVIGFQPTNSSPSQAQPGQASPA
jgi:hypothetical protein